MKQKNTIHSATAPLSDPYFEFVHTTNYDGWVRRTNSPQLIILVHGLGCQNRKLYWSSIPKIISDSASILSDVINWGYSTNFSMFTKLRAIWGWGTMITDFSLIADTLASDIRQFLMHQRKNYDQIKLIGHSQGGLISAEAAAKICMDPNNTTNVDEVIMCATPLVENELAKLHSRFTFNTNPQTKQLSQPETYRQLYRSTLPIMRQHNIKCHYLRAANDPIVSDASRDFEFSKVLTHEGDHNWVTGIQSRNQAGIASMLTLV